MKSMSTGHAYDHFRNDKGSSEYAHLQEIQHFQSKISSEVFKKSPEEKQLLKTRMYAFPNKRHTPVGFNS